MMKGKHTEKIRIWGVVQGVGFRPFLAKLAEEHKMKGKVLNIGGLVEIDLTDTEERIDYFLKEMERSKPEPAEIVHVKREIIEEKVFDKFYIEGSRKGGEEAAIIPADFAICPTCLKEMRDKDNPRYEHPFISCMICGPRYTIMESLPYDRENTTMNDFPMCDFCKEEYTMLKDRRFHAQTISCHHCGPQMEYKLNGNHDSYKEIIDKAAALLKEGRVIGFKAVGGYNLMVNPFDREGVETLRRIKGREKKPFALLFPSMEAILKMCYVDEVERKLLDSSSRPILLLERKSIEELEAERPRNYREIENSQFIGAFLPSMGMQYLLLEKFGGPLIVTSANESGKPIITTEEGMFDFLERQPEIAEGFYNSRKIKTGVDDSVVRVIDKQPQMIRRSKGYVPVPLYVEGEGEVLALGGQLKSSFCSTKGSFAYPSQYFGDLDTHENQKNYEENLYRFLELLRMKPKKVIGDLHPLYYTTRLGEKISKEWGMPLILVQHHHAHTASVMAEHNLQGFVIGVSFDGTGYGTDGAIWGGEFLLCHEGEFERRKHLKYIKMIGGDSSMKEGWKSAYSYIHSMECGEYDQRRDQEIALDLADIADYALNNGTLEEYDTSLVKQGLTHNINTIKSSSMGRLFDGVSAMLGICAYNDYEGQCAIMLENAAASGKKKPGAEEANDLAYDFHLKVAKMIIENCVIIREETGTNTVALSGGVFQNKILMEEAVSGLRDKGFDVYYNVSVSPNDGGISLGQAYIGTRS